MNILVTNDDGIMAEGIRTLAKTLIDKGHQVTIAAPNVENSGKSHAITFKTPLVVQNIELDSLKGVKAFRFWNASRLC